MPVDFVIGVMQDERVVSVLWAKKFVVLLALHLSDAFLSLMVRHNPAPRLRLFVVRLQQEFTRWLLTGNSASAAMHRSRSQGDALSVAYQCTEHFVRSLSRLFLWL